MLYSAKNTCRFFGLNKHSTGLLCLPAKYIAGRMMLVRAHECGMKLHSVQPLLNPLKNITHTSFDFSAFTPAQLVEILADEKSTEIFSNIRHVIIGGAAIDAVLEKRLSVFSNAIFATYGMTETVSHIALRKIGDKYYKKIGPQTEIGVDDENCLWIKDPNYVDCRLQTNDVVHLVDEQYFEWLGRRDFVINSGGVKLHPEQIEEKIKSLEEWSSHSFFISKVDDARFGERPQLVVLQQHHIPALDTLSTILNKMEMPEKIVSVPRFIYTENGKLNRVDTIKLIE